VEVTAAAQGTVSISPEAVQATTGGTFQFSATMDDPQAPDVTWTATGGTVSATGLYMAPSKAGTYFVTATSITYPGMADTATVVVRPGTVSTSYQYDANGNLVNDGTRTFTWDGENRLVRIDYSAAAAGGDSMYTQFVYDGFGRRVEIIEGETDGVVTSRQRFLFYGNKMLEARGADGVTVLRQYNRQGFVDASGTPHYYMRDHLGSIREVVNGAGTVEARYDYDPYGNTTKVQGAAGVDTDLGYGGYYYHRPSGLYLTKYRAYDPTLGRWLSQDPMREKGGLNLYAYVRNSPMRDTDRLGLSPTSPSSPSSGDGFWDGFDDAFDQMENAPADPGAKLDLGHWNPDKGKYITKEDYPELGDPDLVPESYPPGFTPGNPLPVNPGTAPETPEDDSCDDQTTVPDAPITLPSPRDLGLGSITGNVYGDIALIGGAIIGGVIVIIVAPELLPLLAIL
jgi:RHS repeat-associated protein